MAKIFKKSLFVIIALILLFSSISYADCVDTDDQQDVGIYGVCTDACQPYPDDCSYLYRVIDYYCVSGSCYPQTTTCPNGGCCVNGVCSASGTCTDGDGYDNFDTVSSCSDSCGGGGDDGYSSGNTIKDWYCDPFDHCDKNYRDCDSWCKIQGYGSGSVVNDVCDCSDIISTCAESDNGNDPDNYGWCTDIDGTVYDGCSSGKVKERYCQGGKCRIDYYECPNGGCCVNGVCSASGTCTDSDGQNIFNAGSCSDSCGGGGDDRCAYVDKSVSEWYCNFHGHCTSTVKNCNAECIASGADNGCCVNGACQCNCDIECGDGDIDSGEECEPPDTDDNEYCNQETSRCDYSIKQYCVREIHPMGDLDPYGDCDASCQCVEDAFTCRISPYCDNCNHCGDGECNCEETSSSCPPDCGASCYCGDGYCNCGETCISCPPDCGYCDVTPPFTTIYCNGETCLDNCWYNRDVSISFSCSDQGSGCANTRYCFDGSGSCNPSSIYSSVFNLPEGISYMRYFSTDVVGNTEATKSQIVKIDKSLTGKQVLESDIIINYIGSNEEPIGLSYSISPSEPGISVSFDPYLIEPPATTSKMTIDVEPGTPEGTYTIRVIGTGGGITRYDEFELTIGDETIISDGDEDDSTPDETDICFGNQNEIIKNTDSSGDCTNLVLCNHWLYTPCYDGSDEPGSVEWTYSKTPKEVLKEGQCKLVNAEITDYTMPSDTVYARSDKITIPYTIKNTGDIRWCFLLKAEIGAVDAGQEYIQQEDLRVMENWVSLDSGASSSGSLDYEISCNDKLSEWAWNRAWSGATFRVQTDSWTYGGWDTWSVLHTEGFEVVECLNDEDCVECHGSGWSCNTNTKSCEQSQETTEYACESLGSSCKNEAACNSDPNEYCRGTYGCGTGECCCSDKFLHVTASPTSAQVGDTVTITARTVPSRALFISFSTDLGNFDGKNWCDTSQTDFVKCSVELTSSTAGTATVIAQGGAGYDKGVTYVTFE